MSLEREIIKIRNLKRDKYMEIINVCKKDIKILEEEKIRLLDKNPMYPLNSINSKLYHKKRLINKYTKLYTETYNV